MIIVVIQAENVQMKWGMQIVVLMFLAKSFKWKALLSQSIQILTIDFACVFMKLSKLMLLTVSDLLLKMTTKNVQNPFRPRTLVVV